MSQSNGMSFGWMVSLGLHGAFFLILAYWWLPRVVAMKGVGEEYLAVELNFMESTPLDEPEPAWELMPSDQEVIAVDDPQTVPEPIPETVQKPPQEPLSSKLERTKQERKRVLPKLSQSAERGNIKEAEHSEILRQVKPQYPAAAIRAGHQGTVSLLLTIGENGTVKNVEIRRSSGREDCDRAAVEALMKWWRFRPKGKVYERTIDIHFVLQ
jgi:protein TonB